MKIMIIGGSFAGVSCAFRARQLYPEAQITIVEKNQLLGFIPSGFIQYVTGAVASLEEAVFVQKKDLEAAAIAIHLEEALVACFPEEHRIETTKGGYEYDRLVLAYGSIQESQLLEVSDEEALSLVPLAYKNFESAHILAEKVPTANSISIIGGGQAGMEAASAFVQLGKQVSVFETMDYPLFKYFDQAFLAPFLTDLEGIEGLTIHCNTSVKKITQRANLERTVLEETILEGTNKEATSFEIETNSGVERSDLALTMVNVHPKANPFYQVFESHSDNTIKTDAYLETSQADVFAVGDLIQIPALALKEQTYMPLINNAVRSGLVAAENLMKKTQPFKGGLRTIGTQLFGWYLASTGLLEAEAFNYPGKIATKSFAVPARLFGGAVIYSKVTFDADTHQVLGVQLLSQENCLEKINTAALAIETKQTLEALMQKDYFFQPAYTPVFDVINQLGVGSGCDEI
ncbi:oxidoreductase [Enterococcus sp. JM4C]|uniref:NAD(P)/FAD-dependent oxidoreductase n=1 Tax=Candidatus Enterococcus huntleyi TaxID=1857217 RepID=UPI0013795E3B|nr:FAD/NAD(P)-binding oxidoreductase [Enterococcus sp. JM4C]KAF1297352.1 oxidoreductase [Enterococcus sp. JM4C]